MEGRRVMIGGEDQQDRSSGLLRVPPVIACFFLMDVLVTALYLLDIKADQPFPVLSRWLNLDYEGTIASWYSSFQLALVGILLGLLASRIATAQWIWLLLASLGFFFLSVDESIGIHEKLRDELSKLEKAGGGQVLFRRTGDWMLVLAPVLLGGLLLLAWGLRSIFHGRRRILGKFALATLFLIGSAAGMEIVANLVEPGSRAHILEIACEEFGEMIGGTLFLWAAYDLIRSFGVAIVAGPEDRRLTAGLADAAA